MNLKYVTMLSVIYLYFGLRHYLVLFPTGKFAEC